jgi:hypothetical protein
MKKIAIYLIPVLVLIVGCTKDEPISPVPEISFVSASPQTVTAYSTSLVVTISYLDGDGDLGQNNTDANNLFMADSRNGVVYGFRVRQLAPDDANIAITGNLNVEVPSVPIVGSGDSETFTYTIHVVDRAGNESNRVVTAPITVNR